ncbi:hypothetical protein pipiens_006818 [Culex pipiens pipiens]|uniref:Xrn1 N-terminal domain-containing protein n=1 Tax=Culex pipiens pipiens TaxID=38569 RepID=A0ABD1DN44_CULPP
MRCGREVVFILVKTTTAVLRSTSVRRTEIHQLAQLPPPVDLHSPPNIDTDFRPDHMQIQLVNKSVSILCRKFQSRFRTTCGSQNTDDDNNVHPEDKPAPRYEGEMMVAILKCVDRLMKIFRPRQVLNIAIDGLKPLAKMNQQRSLRFRR